MYFEKFLRGQRVLVQGYNGAVVNTTDEDISDMSAAVVSLPLASATLLEVASASANDTSAGSGAQTVRIFGLDSSYAFQTEDISMNGQTAVTSVKTYIFVYAVEVLTVGATGWNEGIISVADDAVTWTSGAPSDLTQTFAQIPATDNISHNGMFCVPLNEAYQLDTIIVGNSSQIITFKTLIKHYGGLQARLATFQVAAASVPTQFTFKDKRIIIPEKSIIRFQARAASTGAVTTVWASLSRVQSLA